MMACVGCDPDALIVVACAGSRDRCGMRVYDFDADVSAMVFRSGSYDSAAAWQARISSGTKP